MPPTPPPSDYLLLAEIDRAIELFQTLGMDPLPLQEIRDGVETDTQTDALLGQLVQAISRHDTVWEALGAALRRALATIGFQIVPTGASPEHVGVTAFGSVSTGNDPVPGVDLDPVTSPDSDGARRAAQQANLTAVAALHAMIATLTELHKTALPAGPCPAPVRRCAGLCAPLFGSSEMVHEVYATLITALQMLACRFEHQAREPLAPDRADTSPAASACPW